VRPVLLGEPTLLELSGPVNVCGDIHGQLTDLTRCFHFAGPPPKTRWLFLGDYVDRGPQSVEVLCLLFALKIRYPGAIWLVRGNHETKEMSRDFGLAAECVKKLDKTAWESFCSVFQTMPLAAVVASQYFCVHGGLSPRLEGLHQIKAIQRPLEVPTSGLVADMLWSDPDSHVAEFAPSYRGATFVFGLTPAKQFLARNSLKMLVRGHQAVDGFDYPFPGSKQVLTVYSCAAG
jgi:serine/threonine-protein phosphatase PP1 catalytic subunit